MTFFERMTELPRGMAEAAAKEPCCIQGDYRDGAVRCHMLASSTSRRT